MQLCYKNLAMPIILHTTYASDTNKTKSQRLGRGQATNLSGFNPEHQAPAGRITLRSAIVQYITDIIGV